MSNRRRHIGSRANPDPNCCLGVFGLSLYTTERDLREVFSKYGPIADVSIVYDQQSRRSRGFSFVYFENVEDAKEMHISVTAVAAATTEVSIFVAGVSVHDNGGLPRDHCYRRRERCHLPPLSHALRRLPEPSVAADEIGTCQCFGIETNEAKMAPTRLYTIGRPEPHHYVGSAHFS
ncbi:hypothetical protein AB205_0156680 [Aquarana catesbeiana]|uniref:RRM domain-containing protein n=1 Tax=Aquarana catesbeiana TaxID=8400 RepID=A0A2G9RY88_AQUCT|nr:hypothetical protein AB205_0156680 [Aquarana catesbeiana]